MACALIFGNVMQVQIDQQAMREGTTGVRTLVASAVQRIFDEGLMQDGRTVMFVGSINANRYFYQSELYGRANNYAHMGAFSNAVGTAVQQCVAWLGVQHKMLGVDLPLPDGEQMSILLEDENVRSMPVYPAEGSIRVIDDVIVVCMSNY